GLGLVGLGLAALADQLLDGWHARPRTCLWATGTVDPRGRAFRFVRQRPLTGAPTRRAGGVRWLLDCGGRRGGSGVASRAAPGLVGSGCAALEFLVCGAGLRRHEKAP